MSSPNFKYFGRVGDERLERNAAGDVLKKYNGSSTSWPTHSTVQSYGQSHRDQMRNIRQANQNIQNFFEKF